jgi:hypothetical protein
MKRFFELINSLPSKISSALKYLDWRPWERRKKINFFLNIAIGAVVSISLLFMTQFQFAENFFNDSIDKQIKNETIDLIKASQQCLEEGNRNARCKRMDATISRDIVFIDIDNDTYSKWGEPLFIPRDKIASFLKLAEKNQAKVVALDTMFDYPSDRPKADAALRKFLADMTRRKSAMHIIFPSIKSKVDGKIRRNIFDDLIDKNNHFHRGVPYASFSMSDKVVRYIRYYDLAKGQDGSEKVIWGVPLLAVALLNNNGDKLKALEPRILDDLVHRRTAKYAVELSNHARIEIGNEEAFSNRIRFALLPPGTLGSSGNLFTQRILPDEVEALQKELKGKIVIIGTSNPDKEGWYETPIGEMAGIYIIGNVANVLLGNRQIRDAPMWLSFAFSLILILFTSYMFTYLPRIWARTVSAIVAFAVIIPLASLFYVAYGIAVNTIFLSIGLIVTVMVMGWRKTLDMLKEGLQKIGIIK